MTANLVNQFNARLDGILGLNRKSPTKNDPQFDAALKIADLLNEMDFDAELAPRANIRSEWTRQSQRSSANRSSRQLPAPRWTWVFILILLLALLVSFRQPVLAAVSRMFGYIFVSDVGFLPMDSTLMLEQPILQEHAGQTVTVRRGSATPQNIVLFLEFNDLARPVDGTWLETSSGEKLELLQWQYWPNTPNSHGVQMIFPPLPSSITQTTLVLPEGWHLPLIWIPASQSNLPDVRAVPYADQTSESSAPTEDLCVEIHGMKLCVLAATTSAENTSVLIQAQSTTSQLIAGSMWQGLVWQTETEQVKLTDEQGNAFPMNAEQSGTLTFPPLVGNQKLTLTVPALLASVDIPDQNIIVDVGEDPQPDSTIPLDVNIQVLDSTVHFSQATFVGDGIASLRLTLNADEPIQTIDGITPASLEMGKPDRVDDLYGGGMLAGSKDIFIELIRPNGRITGLINIPIVSATVIVDGPFEFSFNLTDASSLTPTAAEASPNIFSPAPTPTPFPLDEYAYKGQALKNGDLLFTVLHGTNSDVYAFTPDLDSQPRLVATLPGAVSQIYVHPDYQGLDYLAGLQTSKDGVSYIKDLSLYSVSFDGQLPRLLYSFPPTPENFVGPAVDGDWSYDGRYALFHYVKLTPGNDYAKYLWFDMACRLNENCLAHEITFEPNLELSRGNFAPNDYRILFTGSDVSGTGEMDLFIMDFNPANPTQNLANITANSSSFVDDVAAPAVWTPAGEIFTLCNDGQLTTRFCYVDSLTGQITSGAIYVEHIAQYQVSPSGQFILGIVINHNAPGKGILEIHRFDLNAQAGPALAIDRLFPFTASSPDDRFIAYSTENSDQIQLIDTVLGNTITLYSSNTLNAVTLLIWIR